MPERHVVPADAPRSSTSLRRSPLGTGARRATAGAGAADPERFYPGLLSGGQDSAGITDSPYASIVSSRASCMA